MSTHRSGASGRSSDTRGSGPPVLGSGLETTRGNRGALPGQDEVPLLLELLGTMLQAGLALPRALEIASRVAGASGEALERAAAALQLGADWDHAWPETEPGADAGQLRAALHFAASTGAPSAELLFARARQLRRTRHRELEKRAGALGVRLVIPLGVCSLPAFLCLGVVPVLLAMIPTG
ncbi:type II secretion system F family protein [Sinomonas notoginsengisoli]|uniref:type II secretion system F family protein n=1 Tax=Sinomonas notoginsengisoli TaxID=1457311 RepID=UPI001F415AA4|nr:type II secretion system F family protein [Sinomonas notoginsengisoli]